MKTKIFILLAVFISLSGINEINAQMDTVWSYPLPEDFSVASWAFSPNDSLITIAFSSIGDSVQEGYNILLNTQNGQKIKEFRGTNSSKLVNTLFTPDNSYLIASALTDKHGSANIVMWNVTTGDSVRSLSIDSLENRNPYLNYQVSDLQFTPDGRYLFANISLHYLNGYKAENYNHFVFWDTTNWQIAKQWKSQYEPNSMLISPRGNYYAFYYGKCDSGNCIKIVSLDSADTLIKNLYIGQKQAFEWIFSNDGKYMAARCSKDSIIIWDMDSLSVYKIFPVSTGHIYEFAFASDSSYLVTNGNKYQPTTIWNIHTLSQIYNYQDTSFITYFLKTSNSANYIGEFSDLLKRFYLYNFHFTPNPVVEPPDNDKQTILYPNPTDKSIKIQFNSSEMSNMSIQLFDSEGKTVKNIGDKLLESGENDLKLDCSGLNSGIYFCRMSGKNLNKTFKIIITK